MTDKRWNELTKGKKKFVICNNVNGEKCISRDENGKCIALNNTIFSNGICPFYRDKTQMAEHEIKEYYQITLHIPQDKIEKEMGLNDGEL